MDQVPPEQRPDLIRYRGNGGGYAEMPRPAAPPPYDGVDFRQLFGLLRRHVVLITAVVIATVAPAAYLVFSALPQYEASAVIRLVDSRAAMTGGLAGAVANEALGTSTDLLLSQIYVLRSREVARPVVEAEGLRLQSRTRGFLTGDLSDVQVPADALPDTLELRFLPDEVVASSGRSGEARAAYGEPLDLGGVRFTIAAPPTEVDAATVFVLDEHTAVDDLLDHLVAEPQEGTDVVQVSYTAPDPRVAQRVVNSLVSAFEKNNEEIARDQSRRRREFVEARLAETDSMLTQAQQALSDFRGREQVLSSTDRFAAEQQGLQGLEVRRAEISADRDMYQRLLDGMSGSPDARRDELRALVSSPGIASNVVIAQLYEQLALYQVTRDSLLAAGRPAGNPDVQRLESLIASSVDGIVDAAESHVASLDARITALDDLQARSSAEIAGLPTVQTEEANLVQQVETIRTMAQQLREEYQRARIAEAVEAGPVQVVDRARLPFEPVEDRTALKLAAALLVGLMLGGGGAMLIERSDTSIRGREELEGVMRVPNLAVIPRIAGNTPFYRRLPRLGGGGGGGRPGNGAAPGGPGGGARAGSNGGASAGSKALVTIGDLRSSGAEAYRTLRTNLTFSQAMEGPRTVVITSATSGEGKSTTASNLAVAFAKQGSRVLLIDCDLRKATQHRIFGTTREPGLTQLLLGQTNLTDALRKTSVDHLYLLPSGTLPNDPSELIGSGKMRALLAALSDRFDMIILDTPPLFAAADASILGVIAGGVLMVVRAGGTERAAVLHAMHQLETVGASVIGTVLNDPDAQVPLYGGYYYYSYYGE